MKRRLNYLILVLILVIGMFVFLLFTRYRTNPSHRAIPQAEPSIPTDTEIRVNIDKEDTVTIDRESKIDTMLITRADAATVIHHKLITRIVEMPERKMAFVSPGSARVLSAPTFGSRQSCTKPPLFVIMVESAARSISERTAVRHTWGLPSNSHTRFIHSKPHMWETFFIVGKSYRRLKDEIIEETRQYGDILELDIAETENSAAQKFVHAVMWLTNTTFMQHCAPKFLLKTKDTIFVNMPAFAHWLVAKFPNPSRLYVGHLVSHDRPTRNASSPYYVSKQDYPYDVFPTLHRAPTYLFSWDVVRRMPMTFRFVKAFSVEDAFIGVVMDDMSIASQHNDHFILLSRPSNVCTYLRIFFITNIRPAEQLEIFKSARNAKQSPECRNIRLLDDL